MTPDYQALLKEHTESLQKALEYLKYSYKKIQSLSMTIQDADPELLETWESFVARFSRVTDIFMMKYIRLKILIDDPGFGGTFTDHLNRAEKLGLIQDAHQWKEIRNLRNQATHEYSPKELEPYLKKIKELTPIVLDLSKII